MNNIILTERNSDTATVTLNRSEKLDALIMKRFGEGSDVAENVLTPEAVMKLGREFWAIYLSRLPVEERLAGIGTQERLAGIDTREIVNHLTPEKVVEALGTQEIVTILRRKKDSAELTKQAVLGSMEPDEIEAYLHEIKRSKAEPVDSQPNDSEKISE